MIVLGIDPGSRHTGYGLVAGDGRALRLVASGRISLRADAPLAERLLHLAGALRAILAESRPTLVAVEKPFHGVNARSALVLAEARGAILLTLAEAGIAIEEFAPAEVKSSVCGDGRADKEQVARMVALQLGAAGRSFRADESDALAVALCAVVRRPFARQVAAALGR